jgi:hypothetical protein
MRPLRFSVKAPDGNRYRLHELPRDASPRKLLGPLPQSFRNRPELPLPCYLSDKAGPGSSAATVGPAADRVWSASLVLWVGGEEDDGTDVWPPYCLT